MAISIIIAIAIAAVDRLPTAYHGTAPADSYCRLDTSLLLESTSQPASQAVLVARFLRVLKKHQMRKAD
jgi:hypothetical protein